MGQYSTTYDILHDMVESIRSESFSYPSYLVGDYNTAYATDLNQLFNDYDQYACATGLYELGESVDDFKSAIESGERFADIQEIKPIKRLVNELTELINDCEAADINPSTIYDDSGYSDLFRVWLNGYKSSLISDLINRYESIAKLDDFLTELSEM